MEFAFAVKLAVLMAQTGALAYLPAWLAASGLNLTPAQLEALQRLLALLSSNDGLAAGLHLLAAADPDGWIPGP